MAHRNDAAGLRQATSAVELTNLPPVRRPGRGPATIALREGRSEALGFYRAEDRIRSGSAQAMLVSSYDALGARTESGLTSLLVANSTRDVTALNTRPRLGRVAADTVEEVGARVADGSSAASGTASSPVETIGVSPRCE